MSAKLTGRPTTSRRARTSAPTRAVMLVVLGAVALAGAGCASHARSTAGDGDSASIGGAPSTAPPADGGASGNGSDNGSDNGTTSTAQNTGNGSGGTSPAPNGPVISFFRIKQKPQCPQGTNLDPIPGVDLIVEWSVSGSDKVTLAVDGPGIYNSYGPKGNETFAFGCGSGGKHGDTISHTYTLVAENNGVESKKTLTAAAKYSEVAQV
jgi:hypothetical protein